MSVLIVHPRLILEWGLCDDCEEMDLLVYSFDPEGCIVAAYVNLGEEAGEMEFTEVHASCTGRMCWSCAWLTVWDRETMEEYDDRSKAVVPPPRNPRCPDCGHYDHGCEEARKVNFTKRCSCIRPGASS